jgi:alpha-tubulin suppressor-like RCC1 family protein
MCNYRTFFAVMYNRRNCQLLLQFVGERVVAVAAGGHHSVALLGSGRAFAWGFNRQARALRTRTSEFCHVCLLLHLRTRIISNG